MLRLEAEAAVPDHLTRIELQSRLGRAHLERPSARRLEHARRKRQRRAGAIEVEVVIVSADALQLRVIGVKTRADRDRFLKIERRICDGRKLARRNQPLVDRQIRAGIDGEAVAQHVAVPAQVEIRMLRQVHVRRRLGDGLVLDPQLAIGERVGDLRVERAGYPSSPSGLLRRKTTAVPLPERSASHTRLSNPLNPPCR